MTEPINRPAWHRTLGRIIFASRWLQAPLYLGLILALAVYVYRFFAELVHLILGTSVMPEKEIMINVLRLVDVVMIANLLIMIIIGGYETFVSRLRLEGHPDQPEWLSHVNAGVLKVKLATALIGISSIHLLGSFIAIGSSKSDEWSSEQIIWQIAIHMTFVISALLLAYTDRISTLTANESRHKALE